LCSVKEANGTLWFGNSDGTLTSYDEKADQFNVHSLLVSSESTPNARAVWALHIDHKNRFWVGTENGLFLFDPRSYQCRRIDLTPYLKEKTPLFIRAIAETNDGSIWLGTSTYGVCRVRFHNGGELSVKVGYREPIGSVRSLLASSDGNLYIGYMDGFAILSPPKDSIKAFYTTHNGLCSNFIGCIIEDRKGHIWLGTNSGMSRYSRHQHLFYNYYIAGSNRSAFLYDKTLFWGNNKSLTYFNPDDVDAYLPNERVLITGLEVDDHPVGIGEEINGQTILTDGIPYTPSITLNNDNRDFALAFNNLSYSEEQQKYNYRLLPYQENWLISNEGEKAFYTNLAEGDYTFEVKSIYPDGRSGEVTQLKITILPHWSRTVLFRLLVFVLVLGMVAYLLRWVKLRQRRLEHEMQMKHELLTVSLEREKEKQVRMERENFFTGAAHELRTPLTLILSPLQELLQQLSPSEPVYAKLLTMYKNGSSLHTLVDHLLYVQKIEAGMVSLQLSEVDMTGLLREVCESFNQMAETRNIQFNVSLPPTPINLWVDVPKITSAIRNLLSNAFKYTPSKGSVSLSAVRIFKDGNYYCQITVSDTGEGIPHESQERIFDSFITGKNSPAFSTKIGIGLRIVKNTMDLHHGLVTLQSTSGQGSVFSLAIPEGKAHFADDTYESVDHRLHEASYKEEPLMPSSVIESDISVEKMKKTLLLIEDNVDIRQYIASLFCSKYLILEAADGEEGVRMATDKLPDLIISDVMMPVKDGFACCREIRQQQETAHIPILMLTAKAEDVDVLQGSRSGADDYMMKPFNPEILKAKVENLILLREQLKRIYTKALMLKQEPVHEKAGDEFMQKLVNVIEANLSDEGFNVK
ncbi:MAG: response regulator, partial [Bacteroides sp.]